MSLSLHQQIGIGIALTVAGFAGAFTLLWRSWRLSDMPVSKVRSAAQGFVALEGRAWMLPGPETRSPLSDERCVWWYGKVTRRQGRTSEVVFEDSSSDLFRLADTTGECVIDPYKAQVIANLSRTWFGAQERPGRIPKSGWEAFWSLGGEYRYHERLLSVGEPIYASGWFRGESGNADFDEKRDVGELLAEWKARPRELMRDFDSDRNGVIDAAEWDAARAKALKQVRAGYVENAGTTAISILATPADGHRLLISSIDKQRLCLRDKWLAGLCLLGAFGAAAWLSVLLKSHP